LIQDQKEYFYRFFQIAYIQIKGSFDLMIGWVEKGKGSSLSKTIQTPHIEIKICRIVSGAEINPY